jgi:hypothetical protein
MIQKWWRKQRPKVASVEGDKKEKIIRASFCDEGPEFSKSFSTFSVDNDVMATRKFSRQNTERSQVSTRSTESIKKAKERTLQRETTEKREYEEMHVAAAIIIQHFWRRYKRKQLEKKVATKSGNQLHLKMLLEQIHRESEKNIREHRGAKNQRFKSAASESFGDLKNKILIAKQKSLGGFGATPTLKKGDNFSRSSLASFASVGTNDFNIGDDF